MKTKIRKTTEPKLRMHIRGFPILVSGGRLIDPETQVVECLGPLFAFIKANRETVRQANVEVKILTEKE